MRAETFVVRAYDVGATGHLTPCALFGYLLEVAALHAEELGFGFRALAAKNTTWVLSRLRVELDAPIGVGEKIVIESWPSGTERLFCRRDFRVRTNGGVAVGRATSQWMLLDVAARRAVWPEEAIARLASPERVFEEPFVKIGPLGEPEHERSFDTRFQDVDRNLHVGSVTYLAWALEAIPHAVWERSWLRFFEVHYLAECLHPAAVLSRSRALGDGRFQHAIRLAGGGSDVARLSTAWATLPPAG